MTQVAFAALVTDEGRPLSSVYLSQICNGVRSPRRELAHALSAATGGEVSPGDIMAWMPEEPTKAVG